MVPSADHARWLLVALAAAGLVCGALPLLWVLRRMGRAMFGRPQPAVSGGRYLLALAFGAVFSGLGLFALGLYIALSAYGVVGQKTRIAEVQCIELKPAHLRVYYVPILDDGTRGATETYDVAGDEWTVGGDVLRFRPFLNTLGLKTVFKVSRVEGRWLDAAQANAHKGSAFNREGGTTAGWLQLYRDGARGPLGWLIAGAHGQAVSQLPDRRALYDLYVTPNGFVVDKREL
jgi:hypothetical protein